MWTEMVANAKRNVRYGLTIGGFFAAFFSVIATVMFALGASPGHEDKPVPYVGVIASYFFSGIIGGIVVGFLRPMGRSRPGAIVLGIVGALIGFGAICIMLFGLPGQWGGQEWGTLVLCALIFGTLYGNSFWKKPIPE